jgi:hypothetical protein
MMKRLASTSGSSRVLRGLLVGLTLVAAGCSASGDDARVSTGASSATGPLAVLRDDSMGSSLSGLGPTTLHVDSDCVTLKAGSVPVTLAWRAPQVAWDADAEKIRFSSMTHGAIELSDGDTVEVGGAMLRADLPWVSAPKADCPRDVFVVHDVAVD